VIWFLAKAAGDAAVLVGWSLAWAKVVQRTRVRIRSVLAYVMQNAVPWMLIAFIGGRNVPMLTGSAGVLVIAFAIWWWRRWRRKLRKLAGAIGEKARQRRAALVRTMRQRSRPRPVLRPVPGGAR
jgi:hypothetical protein